MAAPHDNLFAAAVMISGSQSLRTRARYRAQSEGGIYIQPQYREGLERVRAP